MKFAFYLLPLLLLLSACNPDKNRQVNLEDFSYKTTQQSTLFFKNMRSLDYKIEEQPKLQRDLYRHKDQLETPEQPVVRLTIVNHWGQDKAFVVVEPNDYLKNHLEKNTLDTLSIAWEDTTSGQSGVHHFGFGHIDNHFEFARKIYNSLLEQHRLYLPRTGEAVLPEYEQRETFRVTMMDYYRLVNIFK